MARRKPIAINDRQLPFKLTAQSKGVQSAYRGFVNSYGLEQGRRIFLQKAAEQGVGSTLRQRCDSIYTRRRHLRPRDAA